MDIWGMIMMWQWILGTLPNKGLLWKFIIKTIHVIWLLSGNPVLPSTENSTDYFQLFFSFFEMKFLRLLANLRTSIKFLSNMNCKIPGHFKCSCTGTDIKCSLRWQHLLITLLGSAPGRGLEGEISLSSQ